MNDVGDELKVRNLAFGQVGSCWLDRRSVP